jgi:hypothetical protein
VNRNGRLVQRDLLARPPIIHDDGAAALDAAEELFTAPQRPFAADPALAVALILLLLDGAMQGHGVALPSRAALLLLVLLLLPSVQNLTANLLPLALMLYLRLE